MNVEISCGTFCCDEKSARRAKFAQNCAADARGTQIGDTKINVEVKNRGRTTILLERMLASRGAQLGSFATLSPRARIINFSFRPSSRVKIRRDWRA